MFYDKTESKIGVCPVCGHAYSVTLDAYGEDEFWAVQHRCNVCNTHFTNQFVDGAYHGAVTDTQAETFNVSDVHYASMVPLCSDGYESDYVKDLTVVLKNGDVYDFFVEVDERYHDGRASYTVRHGERSLMFSMPVSELERFDDYDIASAAIIAQVLLAAGQEPDDFA